MNKITVIACIGAALMSNMSSFATDIKIADFFKDYKELTNGTWEAEYAITNIPTIVHSGDEYNRIVDFVKKNPETLPEWEIYFSNKYCWFLKTPEMFPVAFEVKRKNIEKTFPKFASLYKKYGTVFGPTIYKNATFEEILNIYDETTDLDKFKNAVKKYCVMELRRYLVDSGIGISVRKVNGVEVNPLAEPMDALSAALNAPRMNGFNAWLAKYAGGKYSIDVSFLPSDEEIPVILEKVIDGTQDLDSKTTSLLQKAMGVDKFNEFVDKFNGTDSTTDKK